LRHQKANKLYRKKKFVSKPVNNFVDLVR
jgi:hypothetical protein